LETKLSLTISFNYFNYLKSIIEVTTIVVVVAVIDWVSYSWVDMALKICFITIITIAVVGFIEGF
jgi:hypothetical protein